MFYEIVMINNNKTKLNETNFEFHINILFFFDKSVSFLITYDQFVHHHKRKTKQKENFFNL